MEIIAATGRPYFFEYQCPRCPNTFIAYKYDVARGHTKSCGCLHKESARQYMLENRKNYSRDRSHTAIHGHSKNSDPTYTTWRQMKQRCLNPKASNYYLYGELGIKICERWLTFTNFLEDMGERPSVNHSIDRIDAKGDYEPSNCRWILKSENTARARRKNNES